MVAEEGVMVKVAPGLPVFELAGVVGGGAEVPPVLELAGVVGGGVEVPSVLELAGVVGGGAEVPPVLELAGIMVLSFEMPPFATSIVTDPGQQPIKNGFKIVCGQILQLYNIQKHAKIFTSYYDD